MKTYEVSAAVLKHGNSIFCAKRKDEGPLAKKWEFPGGKLEKGEDAKEALRRELFEELNLEVVIGDYITTVTHSYPTFNIILHAYFVEIKDINIVLNEHLDSCWLLKEQLDSLDWAEADIPIKDKVKQLI